MNTKVAMWGNSNAVRLPASLASETGLTEGAEARLVKTERDILIERRRQRATLAELLSNTPADAEVAGWNQNGRLGSELL